MAKIGNGAGEFAALTAEAAGKTIAGRQGRPAPGDDLKLTIDYNTKEAGAYPIVLATYEIVCSKGLAADKLPLVKGFLSYAASAEGQASLTELGYAPLPERSAPRSRPRSRTSPDPTTTSATESSEQMGETPHRSADAGTGGTARDPESRVARRCLGACGRGTSQHPFPGRHRAGRRRRAAAQPQVRRRAGLPRSHPGRRHRRAGHHRRHRDLPDRQGGAGPARQHRELLDLRGLVPQRRPSRSSASARSPSAPCSLGAGPAHGGAGGAGHRALPVALRAAPARHRARLPDRPAGRRAQRGLRPLGPGRSSSSRSATSRSG